MSRDKHKQEILLKAHDNYRKWKCDIDTDSNIPVLGLLWFCKFMLKMPDEEYFDRWIDEDKLPVPKNGDTRMAKIYMKEFILSCWTSHFLGLIDLHNKGNEFTWIEKEDDKDSKPEMR